MFGRLEKVRIAVKGVVDVGGAQAATEGPRCVDDTWLRGNGQVSKI